MFQILIASQDVLLEPINYNEDILKTQFYDKVDTYDALHRKECKTINNAGTKGRQILRSVFWFRSLC